MKPHWRIVLIGVIVIGIAAMGYFLYTQYYYSYKAGKILDATEVKGGLIVHLGCENGRLTAALHANDRYLVHGLARDKETLEKARDHIHNLDLYGQVTVEEWDDDKLPYTGNLVNLLVAEDLDGISMDEVARVLAPEGIAYIKEDGEWKKKKNPGPDNIDEWTHHLHGPSNNAVAEDEEVEPPQSLQWRGKPLFSRSHELIPSIRAMVTSGGRIFYVIDEAPLGIKDPRVPSQWRLIARDAYNGVVLWKRPVLGDSTVVYSKSMSRNQWVGYKGDPPVPEGGRNPGVAPECLVAKDDEVYVTLGENSQVSVLDAATGETIQKLSNTGGTRKILCNNGVLVLHREPGNGSSGDIIQATDPATGNVLWKIEEDALVPRSLASTGNRVVYHNTREIVAVNLKDGNKIWNSRMQERALQWGNSGKLVATKEVILFQNNRHLIGLSAENGDLLWEGPGAQSNNPSLFVARGLVWGGQPEYLNREISTSEPLDPTMVPYDHIHRAGGGSYYWEPRVRNTVVKKAGYDLLTGEEKKTIQVRNLLSPGHHFRCYPGKATSRYLLWNKRGVEFMDLEGNNHMRHDWLRGMCELGFMPANGLMYMPPHQCFCYPASKINGFNALSGQPDSARWSSENAAHPLEKGPAYDTPLREPISLSDQWPVYRHDGKRSGSLPAGGPSTLGNKWETHLGGKLTQPIVANGNLYVSQINAHQIYCLDSQSGRIKWTFTAGGKVDSSPTWYRGLLLFGSADGWVYCLKASDGQLVWRFRGAPHERRIVSFGQLESSWPIHGSVLVKDGVAYFLAGRSSHVDGGMYLFGLDPRTGEILHKKHLETARPNIPEEHGHPFELEGFRSDILVSGDDHIYLRRAKFDSQLSQQPSERITKLGDREVGMHLFSNTSLLDDSQWDRRYWMHSSRWPGYYFTHQAPKSGSIMVFNDSVTYASKHFDRISDHSPLHVYGQGNLLYADNNDTEPILVGEEGQPDPVQWLPDNTETVASEELGSFRHPAVNYEKGPGLTRSSAPIWSQRVSIRTRAMTLTDSLLYIAGPPDAIDPEDPVASFQGRNGAYLQVVSKSGEKLALYKLDSPPVFDGLIAAENRLFMSSIDGKIQCFGQ